MTRVARSLLPMFALMLPLGLMAAAPPEALSRPSDVKEITVDRIPDVLARGRGEVTVVLVYRSNCPACQHVMPAFLKYVDASQRARAGVRFFALATDKSRQSLNEYIGRHDFPMDIWRLLPWQPGELVEGFRRAGIPFPSAFAVPHFVVLDARGRVVDQFEGEHTDLGKLRGAIQRAHQAP